MIVIVLCFSGLCDYVLCCSGCSGCSGCRGLGRRGCRCSADERTAAENGGGLGAEPARYLRSALFRASVADGRNRGCSGRYSIFCSIMGGSRTARACLKLPRWAGAQKM